MKFDGTNWVNVGSSGFSGGKAEYINIAFSPSGEAYVAFKDDAHSGKASVMKFDGSNWVNVGIAGFSAGPAMYTSLAMSPSDGMPYVGFRDAGNDYKATVMKFNGTNWINVGNAGFSDGDVISTSLAFNPSDNQPYIAYRDDGEPDGKATVMRYDGTAWVNVGNAGFSQGIAYNTSLAMSPSGQPYVAFLDGGNSVKATVMKFDGNTWVDVGVAGFSAGIAEHSKLAINSSGQPFVTYQDYQYSGKATVMTYDSVFVGVNEFPGLKLTAYPNPVQGKLTLETSEIPYHLSIINLVGKELMRMQVSEPKVILDLASLPGGVYILEMKNDRTLKMEKIIKQ
jgi:hypothetical protein